VAIDSALTISESKELKAQLDSINKPLLAVLLTHPHLDHVVGVRYLLPGSSSGDVPIISSESVERTMTLQKKQNTLSGLPFLRRNGLINGLILTRM
jgi:glyoxylase-like metal-dependent hydrolase (beta-lactamase superfamily II)